MNICFQKIEEERLSSSEKKEEVSYDNFLAVHTTYNWNIKWQKCAGISGLWVLNEIIQKKYPENLKKIVGAVWKLPAK